MNIPISSSTKFSCVLLLCSSLVIPFCFGSNSITANKPLYWNQTLVSSNGVFELGFFKPGKSSNYYIGMWYKQVPEPDRVILWVANREEPISDKYSTHLKISSGNLVLTTNELKTPIWSTNLDSFTASESVEAVLLDSGDFVLRQKSNLQQPLWQSSDHPSNVWLPGYKLGLDTRTGTNKVLTSWKNSDDPALGLFSLQLFINETIQFFLLQNGTEKYWSSGGWDPIHKTFAFLPGLFNTLRIPFNINVIYNENETYFTYMSTPILQTFALDVSGQLRSSVWEDSTQEWVLHCSLPAGQCDVYGLCGSFSTCNENSLPYCNCLYGFQPKVASDWNLNDQSSGCSRQKPLLCMNSTLSKKRDIFWANSNMALPDNHLYVEVRSKEDCELTCLNNCSCNAYAYDSERCSIWIGDLFNVKQLFDGHPNGKTLYVRLNASDIQTSGDKKRLIVIIVGSIFGLSALLGFVVCVMPRGQKRLWDEGMFTDVSLVQFRYKELKNATKNFSEKLGKGSFGSVYKGRLPDSSFIAVKMLEGANQGEKQFQAEVRIIGKVQHVNVVRLCGFCYQGSKRLLVYEYMPNSSLNTLLFPRKDGKFLSWETRYQIALGIAKGLAYLHENCIDCIIHCDIKPENILLDADFCPKIADFGLAKLFDRDFSRVLTTMRGTIGYLAPELISGEALTAKADVYSYGMMLFEFISGRRNTEQINDEELDFFPMRAISKIIQGEDILNIVDHRLQGNIDTEQATRLCKLACWCIQDDDNQRPTMRQVVQILEGVSEVKMPPMPWILQVFADCYSQTVHSLKA